MLKRYAAILFLATALFTPVTARADAQFEELLVRRGGDSANIRVTLTNPSRVRQPGPVVVDLYVRQDASSTWTKVKTWNNIRFIQPGYRVSRDFFDENSALLASLVASGRFEVRASARAPGMADAIEKTSIYDSETGR